MRVALDERDAASFNVLSLALANAGFDVRRCDGIRDAQRLVASEGCGIVVVDWAPGDAELLAVVKEMSTGATPSAIVVLSARATPRDRARALDAGADECVAKPFVVEELLAKLRALVRRLASARVSVDGLEIDLVARSARAEGVRLRLADREAAILCHLARARGRIVTRTELFTELWERDSEPASNLVDACVRRLRAKLGGLAHLVETVRGEGYRLRFPEAPR